MSNFEAWLKNNPLKSGCADIESASVVFGKCLDDVAQHTTKFNLFDLPQIVSILSTSY